MTHDEIMKLEAGRELDALVAEHVMGWKWFAGAAGERLLRPEGVFNYGVVVGGKIAYLARLLHYSTDIAAAWQVVEKMQAEYYWKIRSPFDNDEPCPWFAGLTPLGVTGWNGVPDFDAQAETAPLAICRAALLAVMR